MINKGSGLENTLEEELKDIDEKMSHYDVMIKNLTEQNRAMQHEMQLLHKQKCDLTNQVKVLTEENKVLQMKFHNCRTNNLS
jgi:peptidoglycan hydrolase CwlO-like protein